MKPTFIWLIGALLLALFVALVFNSYTDCAEAGGTLVRGMFWFVCLKGGGA